MKTKRIWAIPFLALALLLCAFALADEGDTVYSRAISLPVDPDPSPGTLVLTYDPGKGSGTATDDPDGPYAKKSKVEIKAETEFGFTAPTDPEITYVFAGWSTNKSATKADGKYQAGRTVEITKNLTLYAIWVKDGKETPTSLIYHENTGKNRKTNPDDTGDWYADGETVTLKGASDFGWNPSKKTFLGWSTDPDAVKPRFEDGDKVVVTGKKNHLYAVWQSEGRHVSIRKYITNKKWDKNGDLILFKAGDTIKFNLEVTNTGDETISKVYVRELLKGAKIKGKTDSDGDYTIKNLDPQETVIVKATYTVKSSDETKSKVVNEAYAYALGGSEDYAWVRLPIRRRKAATAEPYVTPEPVQPAITVYADESLAVALTRVRSAYALAYPDYPVNLVFGDAASYAEQFARGVYGDVFVAEGDAQMDAMDIWEDTLGNPQRLDRILSSGRVEAMENRAVLAGRFGAQAKYAQLPALLSSGQARLGISTGNDPAGAFAAEILSQYGLDAAQLRQSGALVEYASGTDAAAALIAGGCDLAILPAAEAQAAGLTAADIADDTLCDPLAYPAAVLKISASPNASQQFVNFLRGTESRAILTELGYTVR